MNTIQCWDCLGTGVSATAAQNTTFRDISCSRCNATGRVPAEMWRWKLDGEVLCEDRQSNDRSLREEAKRRGVCVVALSDAERGRIDPRTLGGRP